MKRHEVGRRGRLPGKSESYGILCDRTRAGDQLPCSGNQATPVSLTNSYFNLRGESNGDVLNHKLQLLADGYTPVKKDDPDGELAPVAGTPFDFNTAQKIGERIEDDSEQLSIAGGYDHNFVLKTKPGEPTQVATVTELESGRTMEVWTDARGATLYR